MPETPGYNTKNKELQGGSEWEIAGDLSFVTGGNVKVNGTQVGVSVAGTHTVSAGEGTAGTVTIATPLTAVSTFVVQILRGGNVLTAGAAVSASGGGIVVATNGATYVLTAGDVINYFAAGTV